MGASWPNIKPAVGCNYLGNAVGGTVHCESRSLRSLALEAPLTSGHLVKPSLARGTSTATLRVPDPRINLTEAIDRAGINLITHLFRYCSTSINVHQSLCGIDHGQNPQYAEQLL